jgi:hypothetical protein
MRQWTDHPLNLKHGTHKGRRKKKFSHENDDSEKKNILVSGSRARI